jgi:hypothetical protein
MTDTTSLSKTRDQDCKQAADGRHSLSPVTVPCLAGKHGLDGSKVHNSNSAPMLLLPQELLCVSKLGLVVTIDVTCLVYLQHAITTYPTNSVNRRTAGTLCADLELCPAPVLYSRRCRGRLLCV